MNRKPRVYVAGDSVEYLAARLVMELLISAGFEISHRWDREVEGAQGIKLSKKYSASIAFNCLSAIDKCDFFLMLNFDNQVKGSGKWCEFMYAYMGGGEEESRDIPVFILTEGEIDTKHVFLMTPEVWQVRSVEEFLFKARGLIDAGLIIRYGVEIPGSKG